MTPVALSERIGSDDGSPESREALNATIYADYAPSEHEAAWVEQAFKSVPSPPPAPTPVSRD